MRVAIDLIAAEYEPGGMLLVTRTLLQGLAHIDHENEYVVLTVRPDDYYELAKSPNIRIQPVTLPSRRGVLIQHQVFSTRVLQRVRPDVLHVPAYAAPLSWRGALVTTIHDLAFIKVPEQSSLYPRLYHKYIQQAGACRAQRVIAISEQTREELISYWSIPPARIHLIHHALRPALQVQTISPEAIQKMRSRYGQRYLLHVGRIMPRKNVEKLIEAFLLLAERFSDLALVLTGGLGHASENAVRLIETSQYKDRIHLAGWVPEEDMAPLYAAASALIFPSKHEGQGMPTLEAMACGTPAITSYEAASIEIAGDAVLRVDCSQAYPLAEAISRVLTQDDLRACLIERGKKQAQLFHYETCARATLQVYQEAFQAFQHKNTRKVHSSL